MSLIDEDFDDIGSPGDDDYGEVDEDCVCPDPPVPCSICSCLIGDEVGYGDTWDGRWVCEGCAGIEEKPRAGDVSVLELSEGPGDWSETYVE
jgi:hypothetical protein